MQLQTPLGSQRRAFTLTEAADILGVHRITLWRRVAEGKIRVLSGFGKLMIPEAELDQFLGRVVVHKPNPGARVRKPRAIQAA